MENPSANPNMSPEHHLHSSTSTELTNYEPSEFTLFPSLSTELRLKIWQYALQQRRCVTILLDGPYDQRRSRTIGLGRIFRPSRIFRRSRTMIGKPTDQNKNYAVYVCKPHYNNWLLWICKESRHEALRFYRVRFPCRFNTWGKKTPGTFYFNPEYDILRLLWPGGARDTFVEFICDLRMTYDPQHIGLLYLADTSVRGDVLGSTAFRVSLEPKVQEAFREDLKQGEFVLVKKTLLDHSGLPIQDAFYSLPALGFTVTQFESDSEIRSTEDSRKSYLRRFIGLIRSWLYP